jgi:hypothetical protein
MLSKFRKELKRQVRLAITAAIGFIIAFSWRDYFMSLTQGLLSNFGPIAEHLLLFSSVFITFVGVILILITSKLLQ